MSSTDSGVPRKFVLEGGFKKFGCGRRQNRDLVVVAL